MIGKGSHPCSHIEQVCGWREFHLTVFGAFRGLNVVTCTSVVFRWGYVGYFIHIEGDYRDFNKFPSRTITEIERGSYTVAHF